MTLVEVRNRNRTATKLSDTALLEALFPQTPSLPGGYQGTYDDNNVDDSHKLLVNGIQAQNPDFAGANAVDLDYGEAPDLAHLVNGVVPNDNSPVSPGGQAPAIGSPGAGSFNPLDVPQMPQAPLSSGAGSTVVPDTTSNQIATQIGGGPHKTISPGKSGIMI